MRLLALRLYQSLKSTSLQELKERISLVCSDIGGDMLKAATHNVIKRLSLCEYMDGEHLEHIIH